MTTDVNLTVKVEPREITLPPGQEVVVVVTVANASDNVEHYQVHLGGLAEGQIFTTRPEVTKLHPGQSGEIEVTLSADDVRPPLAGRLVAKVVAHSPYRAEVMRVSELVVFTPPAPDLAVSVNPELLTGGNTQAIVELVNRGNTALDVLLDGRDAEGRVRLLFDPERLRLGARQVAQAGVRLSARRPLNGAEIRRQVTLLARSEAGEQQVPIVLAQKPLVPGGAGRLAMAAGGVAVMAAAVLGSAALVVGKIADDPASADQANDNNPSAAAPPAGGAAGASTTAGPSSTDASATPTGGASASGPPGATTTGPPGGVLVLDLTKAPPNRADENQVLTPDAYPGLVLSAVEDKQRPECAGITSASYLKFPGGRDGTVAGAFETDQAGTLAGKCNDLPLRLGVQRAAAVEIEFIAAASQGSTAPELAFSLRARGQAAQETRLAPGQSGSLLIRDSSGDGLQDIQLSGVPRFGDVSPIVTKVTVTPLP